MTAPCQLAERVRQALPERTGVIGWELHQHVETETHVLLTCTVDDIFKGMPGTATRFAIHQRLTAWAATLTEAGLGVVPWGAGDHWEVLIIAADQEAVDREAPAVITYLSKLERA